jgi:hypothetical protein
LSQNLNSPGDRRRLVFWAANRGHEIVLDLSKKVDVLVASENSDFNAPIFRERKVPVVFDLIDAYLAPLNYFDDFARGLAKKFSGQISGKVKPFSHHIQDFCIQSSAVLCSSIEQQDLIQKLNSNCHIILDSHDEITFSEFPISQVKPTISKSILWEGQPATLSGVKNLSPTFLALTKSFDFNLNFVTDQDYFVFLNRFIKRNTLNLLKKNLKGVSDRARIVPWSPEDLLACASESSLAMIPINLAIPMQRLKPENRLLIMWRLGLPCLTSPSPAYVRVSNQAGVNAVCYRPEDWLESFMHILSDREYAHTQVSLGQNYLLEHHTKSILLNKWDRAFESVLEK